jgi:hypothetical protein
LYFRNGERVLFYGEEKEGPSKGALTLFVSGEVSPVTIHTGIHTLLAGRPVNQIYLGAGFLSKVTPAYIKLIADYVETHLSSDIELTIEASYISFNTLATTPRIDRWVYAAQMLNVTNPNYRQTMKVLTVPELRSAMRVTDDMIDKVLVKLDFEKSCILVRAQDVAFTDYETPYEDKVLAYESQAEDMNSISTLEAVLPPYPFVTEVSTEKQNFEFRVHEDFHTTQLSISPIPKLIFRSEAA